MPQQQRCPTCIFCTANPRSSGGNRSSPAPSGHPFPSQLCCQSRDTGTGRGKCQGKIDSIKNSEKVPKALTRFCQTGLTTDDAREDFSPLGNASRFVIAGCRAAGKMQRTEEAREEWVLREPASGCFLVKKKINQHGNCAKTALSPAVCSPDIATVRAGNETTSLQPGPGA